MQINPHKALNRQLKVEAMCAQIDREELERGTNPHSQAHVVADRISNWQRPQWNELCLRACVPVASDDTIIDVLYVYVRRAWPNYRKAS